MGSPERRGSIPLNKRSVISGELIMSESSIADHLDTARTRKAPEAVISERLALAKARKDIADVEREADRIAARLVTQQRASASVTGGGIRAVRMAA